MTYKRFEQHFKNTITKRCGLFMDIIRNIDNKAAVKLETQLK